jgi:1-acyl-sn-glycerol-3-phosphate acyltransferase
VKWRWRRKNVWDALLIILVVYSAGVFLAVIFWLLQLLRRIKVKNPRRIPPWQKNMLIVSNHPSLIETVLIPSLFFGEYVFHPLQFLPRSTPDKNNFYDPWYFFWLRPVSIPIDREAGTFKEAFRAMLDVLQSGKRLILFAEGGRTFKGQEFVYSSSGKRLRKLVGGAGLLARRSQSVILPVWVEGVDHKSFNKFFLLLGLWGFWRYRMTIKIGQPFDVNDQPGAEQATRQIEQKLLELADEE